VGAVAKQRRQEDGVNIDSRKTKQRTSRFTGKMHFLGKLPGENQCKHWQIFLSGISSQNCSASELIFMLLWHIETAMKIT